ncbi:SCP2 sterol-binding domain-containing protein [candidate division KSB1 bacterium]|nr:SCP2 sterol-binding domain-containing protein [candidate division KSB1 bacterium]NIR69381.1 SCP2 sterol-binding domain-containing protein [candidate division KSB1 bacterium]NIS24199.1 SCP2 sterol-binding domain-containing protein [candidate division KSB1 bacterium]NIT71114.1 SCP2 sterol-binding domain-containing protein [candidate division KSB1 bacterium]NIU24818.1 SCP2 sterol-binding domain-containing protein [candidate division KSB1 bacterium]
MEVRFSNPEQMNLLGYFLRDLLRTSLSDERRTTIARQLKGSILFNASGMRSTLVFQKDTIEVCSGDGNGASSQITGDLESLLEVALNGNYLAHLVNGRIKVRGNLFKLLKLMKLLAVVK